MRLSLHIVRANLKDEILIGFQKFRLTSLIMLKNVACSAMVSWFVSKMLLAQTKTCAMSIFFAMVSLLRNDFVKFAVLLDFASSDEVFDFFSNGRVRNIKFAHDVLVKNSVVVVRLDVIENSGGVNVAKCHIVTSFQFYVCFTLQ